MTFSYPSDPPVIVTLRQRLQQETNDIHQLLHREPSMHKLVSEHCLLDDYVHVLNVFFRFYFNAEAFFDGIPPNQRFTHESTPLQWLQQDFAKLQRPLPEINNDPTSLTLVSAHTRENYLGYLYVKQGSTLGGQSISKSLKKSLGLEPGESQFFFNGFGSETGSIWKEFLHYLSHNESSLDADAVVLSARCHFLNLHNVFTQSFTSGGKNGY